MAFHHRKMSADYINETISKTCDFYCEPSRNAVGYCPTACLSVCSSYCRQFPSPIPPRSPPTTTPVSYPNPPEKLSFFLTLSLSILAATFFIFCCYTIYKFYTERYRARMRRRSQTETEETHDDFLDEDHGPVLDHPIWYIRTIGLQPSIINSITVCKYKRGDGLVEGTECSVCLSEFQEDETLRLLPKCNHAFHIPCIDTWLRSHTNCPMCRAGIVCSTPLEQSAENSVPVEVIQEGILENNRESGREREDGACELRIGIEEEGELQDENEDTKEEVGNCNCSEGDEVQPRRRSVSMDSLSASMISLAIANALPVQSEGNSDTRLVKMNESNVAFVPKRVDINQSLLKLMASSSIGRSLPRGPISMKRSLSCSGKVPLSRYSRSRSRNLVLPQ